MELIAIEDTSAQVVGMRGMIAVAHSRTSLQRGLEFDEDVVVRSAEGDFWTGTVLDVTFSLEDTHYAVQLSRRLGEGAAMARLVDATGIEKPQGIHELLDLMSRLRAEPSTAADQDPQQ